jgi:hypothetical protein
MKLLVLALMGMSVHAYANAQEEWNDDAVMDDRVEQRLQLRESLRPHRSRPSVVVQDEAPELSPAPPRKIRRAAYRITIEGFETEQDAPGATE